MDIVLTCKQCGWQETGQTERLLMAKIRMWNHLNRAHPEDVEAFSRAVEERPHPHDSPARTAKPA